MFVMLIAEFGLQMLAPCLRCLMQMICMRLISYVGRGNALPYVWMNHAKFMLGLCGGFRRRLNLFIFYCSLLLITQHYHSYHGRIVHCYIVFVMESVYRLSSTFDLL